MRKFFALTMLLLASSLFTASSAARVPPRSLMPWQNCENVRWSIYDERASLSANRGWQDKFASIAEKIDADKADIVWGRLEQAKLDFHRQNLWLLTSANDSLIAAMIDVEWAFDGIFFGYFVNLPGNRGTSLRTPSSSTLDESKFAQLYNELVAPKVKALASINSLSYNPQSLSVKFADAVNSWVCYNTVRWNDSDSLVEECPEKYFKSMGRGHKREDVRTEWIRVRNTIRDFRAATAPFRANDNHTVNCALDDCEAALMKYFTKYVRGMLTPSLKHETYSEIMRSAVDLLCVECADAFKKEQMESENKLKSPKRK